MREQRADGTTVIGTRNPALVQYDQLAQAMGIETQLGNRSPRIAGFFVPVV